MLPMPFEIIGCSSEEFRGVVFGKTKHHIAVLTQEFAHGIGLCVFLQILYSMLEYRDIVMGMPQNDVAVVTKKLSNNMGTVTMIYLKFPILWGIATYGTQTKLSSKQGIIVFWCHAITKLEAFVAVKSRKYLFVFRLPTLIASNVLFRVLMPRFQRTLCRAFLALRSVIVTSAFSPLYIKTTERENLLALRTSFLPFGDAFFRWFSARYVVAFFAKRTQFVLHPRSAIEKIGSSRKEVLAPFTLLLERLYEIECVLRCILRYTGHVGETTFHLSARGYYKYRSGTTLLPINYTIYPPVKQVHTSLALGYRT